MSQEPALANAGAGLLFLGCEQATPYPKRSRCLSKGQYQNNNPLDADREIARFKDLQLCPYPPERNRPDLEYGRKDMNGFPPYSQKQAADLLGVRQETLKTWREAGRLPFVKIGRKVFYSRGAVQAIANPTNSRFRLDMSEHQSKIPNSPFMTRQEAAEYWRKSVETIDRWAVRLKWERKLTPFGGVLFYRDEVTRSGKPLNRNRRHPRP